MQTRRAAAGDAIVPLPSAAAPEEDGAPAVGGADAYAAVLAAAAARAAAAKRAAPVVADAVATAPAAAPAAADDDAPLAPLTEAEREYLFAAATSRAAFAAASVAPAGGVAPHGAFFVRVLYNGTPLVLPGAGSEFCEVSHFKRLLAPYIPADYDGECAAGVRGDEARRVLARSGDDVAFDTIAPDARDLVRAAAAAKLA